MYSSFLNTVKNISTLLYSVAPVISSPSAHTQNGLVDIPAETVFYLLNRRNKFLPQFMKVHHGGLAHQPEGGGLTGVAVSKSLPCTEQVDLSPLTSSSLITAF